MAVRLKPVSLRDAEVREFQQNTADAIEALDTKPVKALGVLSVTAGRTLVGNEDVVLVDASAATTEIALILPSPRVLQQAITMKVTRAGGVPVSVKAVDIPSTSTPTIDGGNAVSLPAGAAQSLTIVSDGRNFWTI